MGGMLSDRFELFNKKKERKMKLDVRCHNVWCPPPRRISPQHKQKTTATITTCCVFKHYDPCPNTCTLLLTTTTQTHPRLQARPQTTARCGGGRRWQRRCYPCASEEDCDESCRPHRHLCRDGSCSDESRSSIYIPDSRRKSKKCNSCELEEH